MRDVVASLMVCNVAGRATGVSGVDGEDEERREVEHRQLRDGLWLKDLPELIDVDEESTFAIKNGTTGVRMILLNTPTLQTYRVNSIPVVHRAPQTRRS